MLYSGMRKGCGRKDMEMREAAALRQQRRMKQAVQFIHKDSADLLPLDGLKKLGTSKEMQPHSILQRRLLETNLSRCRLNNTGTKLTSNSIVLKNNSFNHSREEDLTQPEEEEDLIYVCSKFCGLELKVLIDTGSQLNFISSVYIEKLGLKDKVNVNKVGKSSLPFQRDLEALGQMDKLSLQLGQVKFDCAVTVVENDKAFISLGNRTLKSLKCVIDMENKTIILGRTQREQVQFVDGKSGSRDEISPGV